MAPYNKKARSVFSKLLGVKQETLDGWMQAIENRIKIRKEVSEVYALNVDKFMKMLQRAKESGISSREIAEITGISRASICNWIKLLEVGNAKETPDLPPQ
jgi:response regulator of citrate/malate metabolism